LPPDGAIAIVVCAALSHRQAGYWRDNATVFEHAFKRNDE